MAGVSELCFSVHLCQLIKLFVFSDFLYFFFSFFKKMLKGTQAFHAVPAEQGSTALWLETECSLA